MFSLSSWDSDYEKILTEKTAEGTCEIVSH